MRRITDHRFEEGGFNEAIQGLVKNSPWWMIAIAVHAIAFAILWNVPVGVTKINQAHTMMSELNKEPPKPEIEKPPPEIKPPQEKVQEVPIETKEQADHNEVDTDSKYDETAGDQGMSDAPFTGPSTNGAIGIGGGAGGGIRGRGGHRNLRAGGGSKYTQDAVEAGLKWLADHQDVDTDGKWDCDEFMKHDPASDKCDGPGHALYDQGVTGLALLAFLGAGYTDRGSARENKYARHVRQGLRFLMQGQDPEGCFSPKTSQHFMYNHAIATLAMCEAYWMTHNPLYKKPAQDGINFIANARNPYLAWRYNPRGGDNDSSVTGWCVMALKSGKFAGLDIDPDAFEGARKWINKVTDPDLGMGGYQMAGQTAARPEGLQDKFPQEKSQSMTAVCDLCRIFLGENPRNSEIIKKGAKLMAETPPNWDPKGGCIDMYYWYYGTLAMFQIGGSNWKIWNQAMKKAIVEHQHAKADGSRAGSWDPIGPWGPDGGRVYSTAVMTMCLEVYYRYEKVFGLESK